MIEGALCIDHVHMRLSIPPKYAVSTIAGYLKGESAMMMFEQFSRLKRNFKAINFEPGVIMSAQLAWTKRRFATTSKININKI